MSRIVWKKDKVISLKLKDGSYAIGQLLRRPYIAFFHAFCTEENVSGVDLDKLDILFVHAVTRQFIKFSDIAILKSIKPKPDIQFPKYWIKNDPTFRMANIFTSSGKSMQLATIGLPTENALIELDDSGEERIIQERIDPNDHKTIDKAEIDSLGIYPNMNERLFLSKVFDKNVDVAKCILFGHPMKDEYWNYARILANDGEPADWGYYLSI